LELTMLYPITGILIAVPCLETISAVTGTSLYNAGSFFASNNVRSGIVTLQSSLITTGRTRIANRFVHSDYSHIFWLDGDIGVSMSDIATLLTYAQDETFVAGGYPKKVENGPPEYSIEFKSKNGKLVEHQDIPAVGVNSIGNGCQIVHKSVYQTVAKANPQLKLPKDHLLKVSSNYKLSEEELNNSYHYYHETLTEGEDVAFCHRYVDAGGDIWLINDLNPDHIGSYNYRSDDTSVANVIESIKHVF